MLVLAHGRAEAQSAPAPSPPVPAPYSHDCQVGKHRGRRGIAAADMSRRPLQSRRQLKDSRDQALRLC